MVNTPQLLAAVDLGSNSFRLIVGRVEETDAGSQIYQVDALRESVRLAAGLSSDKMLDRASQVRGWDALKRFGERLRDRLLAAGRGFIEKHERRLHVKK